MYTVSLKYALRTTTVKYNSLIADEMVFMLEMYCYSKRVVSEKLSEMSRMFPYMVKMFKVF